RSTRRSAASRISGLPPSGWLCSLQERRGCWRSLNVWASCEHGGHAPIAGGHGSALDLKPMNERPTDRLAIAIAQLNPTVGDIAGNANKARHARAQAAGDGADLV